MDSESHQSSEMGMDHIKVVPNQVTINTNNHVKDVTINMNKQYKCPICNLVFNSNDNLLKHIHFHKYGNPAYPKSKKRVYAIQDPSINKSPVRNAAEQVEIVTEKRVSPVQEKKQYKCPICQIVCTSNDLLLEHIHIHKYGNQSIHNNRQKINQTGNYKCPICRSVYETNDELLRHVYVHKFGKEPEVVNSVKENYSKKAVQKKEYKCPICNVLCNGNNDLSIHLQTHVKVPLKHKCMYCGRGFERPSALEIHVRTHTKEKPFQCSVCDDCFSTGGQLIKHMKSHVSGSNAIAMTLSEKLLAIKEKEVDCINDGNRESETNINLDKEIFHGIEEDSINNTQNASKSYLNINETIENTSTQNIENVSQLSNSHQYEENTNLNINKEILSGKETNSVFLGGNDFNKFNNFSIKMEKPDDSMFGTDNSNGNTQGQSNNTAEIDQFDHQVLVNIKQEDAGSPLTDTNHIFHDTNIDLIENIKQEDTSDNGTYCVDGLTEDGSNNIIKDEICDGIKNEDLISEHQESDPLSWTEPESGGNLSVTQATFSCHLCPIVFDEWVKLEEHIKEHVSDTEPSDIYTKMDKDQVDPKSFLICSLNSNVPEDEMEHSSSINVRVEQSNFSLFVCSMCQNRFDLKSQLADHMTNIHGVADTTRCPVCWKRFRDVTVLAKHMFIHTYDNIGKKNESKVSDNDVNVNPPNLRQRIPKRIQEESKTYKCPICSDIFNRNSELLYHVALHKKESLKKCKYKCEYCGVSYEKPSQLKKHKLKHSEEKAYECSICGEKFSYTAELKKHLTDIHLTKS